MALLGTWEYLISSQRPADISPSTNSRVLEAQWNQLPDYVEKGTNAIVMADVSEPGRHLVVESPLPVPAPVYFHV